VIPRRAAALAVVVVTALAGHARGAPDTSAPSGHAVDLDSARAAQLDAARRYRESLESLQPLRDAAAERAAADLERRRTLAAQGLIAAAEVTAAEKAVATARAAAEETRAAIRDADTLVAEVEAARELAALPPATADGVREGPTITRYDGSRNWSVALLPTLDRYFAEHFHRPLPVSALGQTAVHDRLGFDHRNAIDIAVHPDTPEGRELMQYLRGQRIPFLAFRGAQAGVATGAHVHVGEASLRWGASNGSPKQ
jgi:hypothetical protein